MKGLVGETARGTQADQIRGFWSPASLAGEPNATGEPPPAAGEPPPAPGQAGECGLCCELPGSGGPGVKERDGTFSFFFSLKIKHFVSVGADIQYDSSFRCRAQ